MRNVISVPIIIVYSRILPGLHFYKDWSMFCIEYQVGWRLGIRKYVKNAGRRVRLLKI